MIVMSASLAVADLQLRQITLNDGTTIYGKLLGLDHGEYIVESPKLGQLRLKEGDVRTIGPGGNSALGDGTGTHQPGDPGNHSLDLHAAQQDIMSNPEMIEQVQALAADPEIVELISDPAFMQAVKSRDMREIMGNPRMAKLMGNPKIKALIEKIQASHPQGLPHP